MNSDSRLFFKTPTYDPATELPLYVFDTSFLPTLNNPSSPASENKIVQLTSDLVLRLPSENYALVLLASGFSSYDSAPQTNTFKLPLNLIKFFKLIPAEKKEFLVKIYLVHGGNWIVKSIVDFLKNFWNFRKEIIYCENLTRLGQFIDITNVPISLTNYIIDRCMYQNEKIVMNRHLEKMYGQPLILANQLAFKQFSKIYNNLVSYMVNSELDKPLLQSEWQMLIRSGELDSETALTVDILSDCLQRDQTVCLSDFSFLEHFMVLTKFIVGLSESDQPLMPTGILLHKRYDFNNAQHVTEAFNQLLKFPHEFHQQPKMHDISNGSPMLNMAPEQYNNGYILVKLVKFLHLLTEKLNREFEIMEPSAKNLAQLKDRQHLRLALSFTKILYNENGSGSGSEDDDIGFDVLFKFISSVLKNYKLIQVNGTYLEDFDELISLADLLEYEEASDGQAVTDSPLPPKKNIVDYKIRKTQQPPTPPLPRKLNLQLQSRTSSASSAEGEGDDKENSIPSSKHETVTDRLRNELVKPSDTLTSKLVKYTEKDLIIQQQRAKTVTRNGAEGPKNLARGRNVSRLTMMYEEKLLGAF